MFIQQTMKVAQAPKHSDLGIRSIWSNMLFDVSSISLFLSNKDFAYCATCKCCYWRAASGAAAVVTNKLAPSPAAAPRQ